jgi:hypothetical protein
MADVRTAWTQAGEQLSGLGTKLKLHYESQRGTDETGEQVRAQDDVKDAVRKLGVAVQDAVDAMCAAARDQAVKDDVRQVGRSLRDALGVTFSEISDELGKAFSKPGQTTGGDETGTGGTPGPGGTEQSVYDDPTAPPPSPGSTSTPPATPPPTPPREPGDPTP